MKILGMLVIASILMTSGCAAFKANNLPTVDKASYTVQNQERVKVFSTWKAREGEAMHKNYFDAAIRTSGCCDIVGDREQADLVVDGTSVDEFNKAALIPAMISGFSFGVIPSWANIPIHLRVTATSSGEQHTYDLADSATMVTWLPMLLAMPFTGHPVTTEKDMTQNAYNTLVSRMKTDGLLTH
ncbi:MAG TPA: hypothetical protein ENH72_02970 [Pseudomonas sabulinigri]|uniref:Lipoprotein n=1 Tax=marine sediment metagenome TaxID=412755 RepID=A0A0F9PQJ4_9ZZZZ|nr:hypothetical protein [Halopseudomonas sabulinigri]HEC50960.1 hypothetical protein [Halopseudomonas sabulinigri]|tara:strand:- start:117 stop:671 length:555 start_codon:yes stop_codon:yes gene_type:complete